MHFVHTRIARDVDLSKSTGDDQGHASRWTAPEVWSGLSVTKESDIFSFGMVVIEVGMINPLYANQLIRHLFKVFTGKPPFSGMETLAAMTNVLSGGRTKRPDHPDFTESLWELTQRCWGQNAQDRPNILEVIEVLKELSAFDSCFGR